MYIKLNAAQLQYNTIHYNTIRHLPTLARGGRWEEGQHGNLSFPSFLARFVFPFPNLLARSLCAGKKRVIDSVACWLKLRQRNLA